MAAGFLAIAIGVLLYLRHHGIEDATVLIAVLVLPVLIYLVVSGDVSEVAGPGGFSAKFREVAEARVNAHAEIEEVQLIGKAHINALQSRARLLKPGVPVALSFRLGAGYDSFMIEQYIDALLRIDPRLTVVFISTDGDFQASSDGANVRAIIANDHFENELKQAITSSDLIALKELIAVSTRAIAPETTNAEALRIMLDDKVRSLVAVDAIGRPAGVVRRDDIMARMLTKLAG